MYPQDVLQLRWMAENDPELWDLPECWNHKCVPPHDSRDGAQGTKHVRQTFLSHILRSWDVGFVAQMERDLGSQEPRNIGYYSLGGRVFWQSGGQGIAQVTVYSPALRKGFPSVTALCSGRKELLLQHCYSSFARGRLPQWKYHSPALLPCC